MNAEPVKRVWNKIAVQGQFKGHPSGPFEMNSDTFSQIVKNFDRDGIPIPIDYEHASEANPTSGTIPQMGAPAAGWIHRIEARSDGLFGLVEWLPKAKDQIKTGEYRYISPAVRFGAKHTVTGESIGARLSSAGLTNTPFLKALPPLLAKNSGHAPAFLCSEIPAQEANEDDGIDAEDLLERIERIEKQISGSSAEDDTAITATDLTENPQEPIQMADTEKTISLKDHEESISKLTLQLKDADSRASASEIENKRLLSEIEKRDEAVHSSRIAEAFETYSDSKKLSDHDKKAMSIVLKSDPATFEALYPRVSADKRPLLTKMSDGKSGYTLAPGQLREVPDIRTLADKYVKEGLSLEDATNRAYSEVSALS